MEVINIYEHKIINNSDKWVIDKEVFYKIVSKNEGIYWKYSNQTYHNIELDIKYTYDIYQTNYKNTNFKYIEIVNQENYSLVNVIKERSFENNKEKEELNNEIEKFKDFIYSRIWVIGLSLSRYNKFKEIIQSDEFLNTYSDRAVKYIYKNMGNIFNEVDEDIKLNKTQLDKLRKEFFKDE